LARERQPILERNAMTTRTSTRANPSVRTSTASAPLPVVSLPGLRADVLGGYMAAVGLLRVVSRERPSVRGAWRDGAFVLVGGPVRIDELVDHLVDVARDGRWSSYERFW
jgi:hypothetical protein